MTVDLAALAKLASDCHEEPPFWLDVDYLEGTSRGWIVAESAAYIAAASPDVVAALVRVALAAKAFQEAWDAPDWMNLSDMAQGAIPHVVDLRAALADLDR